MDGLFVTKQPILQAVSGESLAQQRIMRASHTRVTPTKVFELTLEYIELVMLFLQNFANAMSMLFLQNVNKAKTLRR